MNVNTEVAGLGYVTSKDISGDAAVANLAKFLSSYLSGNGLTIEGVISALIRIYGDNYRYDGDFIVDVRNVEELQLDEEKESLIDEICEKMEKVQELETEYLDLKKREISEKEILDFE